MRLTAHSNVRRPNERCPKEHLVRAVAAAAEGRLLEEMDRASSAAVPIGERVPEKAEGPIDVGRDGRWTRCEDEDAWFPSTRSLLRSVPSFGSTFDGGVISVSLCTPPGLMVSRWPAQISIWPVERSMLLARTKTEGLQAVDFLHPFHLSVCPSSFSLNSGLSRLASGSYL